MRLPDDLADVLRVVRHPLREYVPLEGLVVDRLQLEGDRNGLFISHD